MSIQEQVWSYLRNKGLPEKTCAAIMGNIEQESSFDSNEREVGGDGFGLFQWSYDRKIALQSYGTDFQHQMDFFWSELTGENTSSMGTTRQWMDKSNVSLDDFLKGNGSIDQLTEAFCVCWERANSSLAYLGKRQTAANKYFSQFTGTAPSPSVSSDALNIEATNYQTIKGSEQKKDVLFGRRYRITVSDQSGTALDVSQLRCTFNIVKTIQMQPNLAEISIYNLNAKTENAIMTNGTRITVEAGYEGAQFGLIFDGDILQTIRERENGTTFKLTILSLDSDRPINFGIANYSIARGQTARDIVDHIVNRAQYAIDLGSISDRLDGPKLTRGKVMFGKESDYLRQIAKTYELQYYMDDGRLNLIHLDDLPKDEIFELSPDSGLVGTPEQTDYGVAGQCLLNPQIKLNSLIHINNSLVRAKRIDINGSNTIPGATTSNGEETTTTGISGVRDRILSEAKKLCDNPNVQYSQDLRGQTVDGITYYDCSLFAKHCYETAGLDLLDITTNQWQQVQAKGLYNIPIKEAKPGDLVFWFENGICSHVAIYAGNNDIYAARGRNGIYGPDQVSYGSIYGDYKIGRPQSLISADGGELPSASGNNTAVNQTQTLFRGLDKDGIYRVIKITYVGDTRGTDWYLQFETIDQLGGAVPSVSN